MYIVCDFCAVDLHFDQTKRLKSLDYLTKDRGLNSHLPAQSVPHHQVAAILHVIERNAFTSFDLQLLKQG
jgi:hypothetical protein